MSCASIEVGLLSSGKVSDSRRISSGLCPVVGCGWRLGDDVLFVRRSRVLGSGWTNMIDMVPEGRIDVGRGGPLGVNECI